VSKKVSDILPKTEILAQLAEEASELAQAALKLRRALDGTNPTPKSVGECEENLMEEFADISNAVDALCDAWFGNDLDSESEFWNAEREIETAKYKRWLSRLKAKEQSDE
jgi:NTP pyrophosphatase (non-canonical NTP hydrolase)